MPMLHTPIDAEAGAAMNGGRRPTIVAAAASASPELSDRPRRRTFTAKDKLRILADIDRAAETRGIGAILRREGLYSSTLSEWRRQRDAGAVRTMKEPAATAGPPASYAYDGRKSSWPSLYQCGGQRGKRPGAMVPGIGTCR
jgi:transposase-like protein